MRSIFKFLVIFPFAVVVILVSLLITAASMVFLPYQWLVILAARVFRPDLVSIVRGASNVMFSVNTGALSTANISIYAIISGVKVLTIEELRNRAEKYLLNETTESGTFVYAKLKQVLTPFMGYRFFKFAESFDLAEHIRPYDQNGELALPNNRLFTEKDLKRLCAKLTSKPWEVGRSNWEILVIKNFKSGDSDDLKTLLLFRINHGYADGFCCQRLLTKITDGSPEPQKFEVGIQIPWRQKVLQMAILPLRAIWDTAEQMTNLKVGSSEWILGWKQKEPREPMGTFIKQYPAEMIKEIKNEFKVPYATILFTALSTAIYKVLSHAGKNIPKRLLCVLPLPKPHHPGGMTNHLAGGIMVLPIFEKSTTSNIKLMSEQFKEAMQSAAPLLIDLWLNMLSVLPVPLAQMTYMMVSPSVAVSLMPAAPDTLKLCGGEVSGIITMVTGGKFPSRQGVTVAMGGMNGMQRISVVMDESVFPHREAFAHLGLHMEQEIENMYERVLSNMNGSMV